MRYRLTLVVIVLAALATGGPSAQSKELDHRTITCREFLASGQANMLRSSVGCAGITPARPPSSPISHPTPTAAGWAFIASNTRMPTSSTPPNKF
jgi:hypothetical protein